MLWLWTCKAEGSILPAVMRREQLESRIRSQRESAEKPANWQKNTFNSAAKDAEMLGITGFKKATESLQALMDTARGPGGTLGSNGPVRYLRLPLEKGKVMAPSRLLPQYSSQSKAKSCSTFKLKSFSEGKWDRKWHLNFSRHPSRNHCPA